MKSNPQQWQVWWKGTSFLGAWDGFDNRRLVERSLLGSSDLKPNPTRLWFLSPIHTNNALPNSFGSNKRSWIQGIQLKWTLDIFHGNWPLSIWLLVTNCYTGCFHWEFIMVRGRGDQSQTSFGLEKECQRVERLINCNQFSWWAIYSSNPGVTFIFSIATTSLFGRYLNHKRSTSSVISTNLLFIWNTNLTNIAEVFYSGPNALPGDVIWYIPVTGGSDVVEGRVNLINKLLPSSVIMTVVDGMYDMPKMNTQLGLTPSCENQVFITNDLNKRSIAWKAGKGCALGWGSFGDKAAFVSALLSGPHGETLGFR